MRAKKVADEIREAFDAGVMNKREIFSPEEIRPYYGISSMGDVCDRKRWYAFRFYEVPGSDFNPRALRRADTGHVWEQRVVEYIRESDSDIEIMQTPAELINWLESQGIELDAQARSGWIEQGETNNGQLRVTAGTSGHIQGHPDGFIFVDGELFLWENKATGSAKYKWNEDFTQTISNKTTTTRASQEGKFFEFKRRGLKKWNYTYYVQLQIYMHEVDLMLLDLTKGKMGIERGIITVVGTDTDEIATQILKRDDSVYEQEVARAERIIASKLPPEKITETRFDASECRFCSFQDICHNNKPHVSNCRSCAHAQPTQQGEWICHKIQDGIGKARAFDARDMACGGKGYTPVKT